MAKKKHDVTKYATAITSGRVIANKWTTLAGQRHLDDLARAKLKSGKIYFDELAADNIIDFFQEHLVFYEGAFDGKPFMLTPHQKFIVGSIFGWKNKNGFRRFRTAYIEEAKGQGKSPLAGGIGLYGLALDDEPGAEIYSAATTLDQASILFRDAKLYAEASEMMMEMLTIGTRNIAYEAGNSFFRPISSERRGLDGKRPHFVLIDEIHEHRDDVVVRKMSAGTKGRGQSLIFEITNAGYDRHSICFEHHQYSQKVLEGIIKDDAWFCLMTGLDTCEKCQKDGKTIPQDGCPDCDDWRNPKVWEKANPNIKDLGKPFKEYLKRQVREAKEMPSQENIVKRLNFCIWTESLTKWIPADSWNACTFVVDPVALKGRTCYSGLDLSQNKDLTALVHVFPPVDEAGKYEILCRFFMPEDNMPERILRDKVPYDVWVRGGYITATPGNLIDYAFILKQVEQDTADYHIQELAFDRWGSQKITTDLQDLGFVLEGDKKTLIQFGQGWGSMSPPIKELERLTLAKEIAHGGNPVLAWNVSIVSIRSDLAGNQKFDKDKSIELIDGAVALAMAIGRAMLQMGPIKSVYDGSDLDAIKKRMAL